MADYIVQKPTDRANLSARAAKLIPTHLHITPKYDGCCAVMAFTSHGYHASFSAVGNLAPSLDHIGKYIAEDAGLQAFAGMCIIGEAWIEGREFKDISGIFRRQRVQPELRFAPFDVVRYEPGDDYPLLSDDCSFGVRILRLGNIRSWDSRFLVNVPQYQGDVALAETLAKEYKAKGGYDGAIARDPDAPYVVKRSADVIKFKPVLSLDLRIKRVTVDVRDTKLGGYITVDMGEGQECDVGTGLTQADLTSFQNELARGAWINKIAEVECMGLTPAGKMREPRFKGLRFDKVEADR